MVACLQAYRKAVKEVPPENEGDGDDSEFGDDDDDGWLQRTYNPYKKCADRGVGLDLRGCKLTETAMEEVIALIRSKEMKKYLSRVSFVDAQGVLISDEAMSFKLLRAIEDNGNIAEIDLRDVWANDPLHNKLWKRLINDHIRNNEGTCIRRLVVSYAPERTVRDVKGASTHRRGSVLSYDARDPTRQRNVRKDIQDTAAV